MKQSLRAARINKGYTQKNAAELFGVHYQTLAKWERNNSRMPYEAIAKIQNIYGIAPDEIFFGDINDFIRSTNE